MNPRTGHHYARLPEASKSDLADKKRNTVALIPEIDEPPPPSSYREISTVRSGILLCCIILGNCFCSGCICLCFWGFSKIDSLTRWEQRAFNTLSLLLSAALSFGIGFMFDQVGLLARGALLQGGPYSVKGIGYIMRGSLFSYTQLFMHQVRTRQGLVSAATWVLLWFVICSLSGRFGVAFLGFTFNLEDEAFYHAAIVRPDWVNGTIIRDDSIQKALEGALHLDSQVVPGGSQIITSTTVMFGAYFEMAQFTKGLPWLLPRAKPWAPYLNNTATTSYAMNVSHFSHDNLTMEELSDNTVAFTYKLQDFQDNTPVPAKKQALIKVHCQAFDTVPDFWSGNFSAPALRGSLDWMFSLDSSSDNLFQIWLVGKSIPYSESPALVKEHSYIANSSITFNCSISVDSDILAQRIQDFLLFGILFPYELSPYDEYIYREFSPTLEFHFGISRQDRHASAVWLSAYVGNYIANVLSFLNDNLRRHPIQGEDSGINTNLDVNWRRLAGILGALAAFQVLVGLAGLLYCDRTFEVLDDAATFSYMYRDFPFSSAEERQQEDAARLGKFAFVKEGDRVRWKFVPKDVKAA